MNIAVLLPSYDKNSAIMVRLKYYIKALKKKYEVMTLDLPLKTKLHRFLWSAIPSSLGKALRTLKNVDLILASSPPSFVLELAYLAKEKYQVPYVADIRDLWEEFAKRRYPKIMVRFIIEKYLNSVNNADIVITTTNSMSKYYEKKFGRRPFVIPNGADVKSIKCNQVERTYEFTVLADFNNPYHNLNPILKCIKGSKYKVLIIGSGRYLKYYQKMIKRYRIERNVKFVGKVPYENLSKYLCKARIGVVGRPFERYLEFLVAIPTKVYDYMAASLALLAYGPPCSELENFIKKYNAGIYLSHEKCDEELIESLLDRGEKIGRNNRTVVEKYFDRNKLSMKILDIIKELKR